MCAYRMMEDVSWPGGETSQETKTISFAPNFSIIRNIRWVPTTFAAAPRQLACGSLGADIGGGMQGPWVHIQGPGVSCSVRWSNAGDFPMCLVQER